jgi:outer membrane protein OmpA-like peptidoglycan-associated protein
VVIEGYADPVGTPAFNEWLSDKRARAVADHLAARGVERARLTIRALGSSRLVCDDDTPACRARNRRAEAATVPR